MLSAWVVEPMRARLREVARPLHAAVLAECRAILPVISARVAPGDPWGEALEPMLGEIRDPHLRYLVGLVFESLARWAPAPDRTPPSSIAVYDVRIAAPAVVRRARCFGSHWPWSLEIDDRALRYTAHGDSERLAHIACEPVMRTAFAILDDLDWPPGTGGTVIASDDRSYARYTVLRHYGPRGDAA